MKNTENLYTEKTYCNNCNVVYQVQTTVCEKCGCTFNYNHFWVDDRHIELQRFRAARSMHQYNLKMGNI